MGQVNMAIILRTRGLRRCPHQWKINMAHWHGTVGGALREMNSSWCLGSRLISHAVTLQNRWASLVSFEWVLVIRVRMSQFWENLFWIAYEDQNARNDGVAKLQKKPNFRVRNIRLSLRLYWNVTGLELSKTTASSLQVIYMIYANVLVNPGQLEYSGPWFRRILVMNSNDSFLSISFFPLAFPFDHIYILPSLSQPVYTEPITSGC